MRGDEEVVMVSRLTLGEEMAVILHHFSSSSVRNSFGLRSTQPGLAINRRRKTPPTTVSPAASENTTVKSSGSVNRWSGFDLCFAWNLQLDCSESDSTANAVGHSVHGEDNSLFQH